MASMDWLTRSHLLEPITERGKKVADNSEIKQYARMAVEDAKIYCLKYQGEVRDSYIPILVRSKAIDILRREIYDEDKLRQEAAEAVVNSVYPCACKAFQQWCKDFDDLKKAYGLA